MSRDEVIASLAEQARNGAARDQKAISSDVENTLHRVHRHSGSNGYGAYRQPGCVAPHPCSLVEACKFPVACTATDPVG
jgi:uncharacterized protein with PIN domain